MNMLSSTPDTAVTPTARDWARLVHRYGRPSNSRAATEVAITIIPLLALWALTWALLSAGQMWALVFTLPLAGLLLRVFIIQHDCGHGSFFSSKQANTWVGRMCGVLTLTPYDYWNHAHKIHHMGAGSLTRRGIGDIKTMTVAEYQAASTWQKLRYRLYRNPVVMFGLGPAYIFLIDQRLPIGSMRHVKPWVSTMGTNFGIALLWGLMIWAVGWKLFLMIQLPVTVLAASGGVWLFYVQHQFEDTIWEDDQNWDFHEAALHGSSHYDLPQPLRWFSGNIGLHHIHHLSSRIPFYRLPSVIREFPELRDVNRMTLWQSIKCVKLSLWDADKRVMVGFRR